MKTFKRTLSCFLALLMIFSSFSVLSYAAFGDGSEKSVTIETRFFVDGVETDTVKVGDKVEARIYIATDYKIATTTLFWVYPKEFFEFDPSNLTNTGTSDVGDAYDIGGALNSSATSIAQTSNLGGFMVHQEDFILDSMSDADNLVYEGYLTEEYFDDKGWVSFSIDSGVPVVLTADNGNDDTEDDHLIEFTFTVKEGATGEGYFHIPEESVMNTTGQDYGFTAVLRAKSATQFMANYSDFASVREYDVSLNDKNTVKLGAAEATKYAVTYSYTGEIPAGFETPPTATEAEEGDIISAPVVENIPEGYELTWTATGATLNEDGTYTVGAGAVAFLGTWAKTAPTEYDVTYSFANEAPNGITAPEAGTVEANGTIAAPAVDVPAGYTLTWAVEGATKNEDGSYTAGEGDVAFVGTWAKIEYDVTYSFANEAPNGITAPAAGKTTVGATIAAPAVDVPAGYTLTWAVEGATKNDDGSYTAGANNVEFVGTWAKNEYDVTYSFANEAPNGITAPAAGKTTVGATIAAPAVDVPAGYTLTWAVEGATKNDDGSYTAGANNVEFIGTWAKIENAVTYTFSNEGPEGVDAPAAGKTTVGATIAAPSTVAPDGWTLTWAVEGATKNDDGSYTAGSGNVSFVGTWAKQSYTITYYLTEQDYADGKVYDTQTVVFGDAITAIDNPEVAGMIFDAWDIDFPATMPAENLEAIAIFTPIVVTFYDVWGDPIDDYTMEVVTEITDADLPTEGDATAGEDVNFVEWRVDGAKLATPYELEGSVDVYAYCTVDIVYYEDEELTKEYDTYTFDFGHLITADDLADLGEPTKTGYEFDGWDVDYVDQEATCNNYAVATWIANEYEATFTAGKGAFAEGTVTTVKAKFDEAIEFTAEPVLEGYTFKGWTDVEGGEVLDELVMDAEGKTFYPVFVENGQTAYTVEIYLMDTDGKYAETASDSKTEYAAFGTTVETSHDKYAQDEWFSADANGNVLSGVVAEDGSLVLKLYYKRATVEITVNGETDDYYVGEEIPAPTVDEETIPDGYEQDETNPWVDENGDPVEVPYEVKEDGNPTEIKPNIVPNDNTPYTVEIYLMDAEGNYGAATVITEEGTTDTTATVAHADYAQEAYYLADTDAANVYEANIAGDGSAVLKLYYKRAAYEVVIDGEATTVLHGATVTAPETAKNTEAGYVLASWNDGAYAKGEVITVTGALTLVPTFEAVKVNYTVEIYLMDAEGNYGAATTVITEEGTTGTTATVAHADYAQETYYLADDAQANVFTGTIAGDGSLVLKLYYKRATVEITVNGETDDYYVGEEIPAPTVNPDDIADGYRQDETNPWVDENGDPVEVPYEVKEDGNPTEIKPNIVPNDDTPYTVEIYLMDAEGNYGAASDTDVLEGTTDTLATAAHADYAQESYYLADTDAANVYEANIAGDGSAVLKLYFERVQYDVTIDGVTTKVYHGATINAPEATTQTAPAGYAFAGWNNGTIAAGEEITVTEAITLVPYFAEGAANYTVEIYLQDAEGNYGAASDTKTETGKTGDEVTIAHADYAQAEYYLADDAQANVFTGTVAGDGSLVLKLYFKRAAYTVAFEYEDGTAIGEAKEVLYGAAIEAPAYETPDGMNLLGWYDKATNEKMPTTMPAKNATYVVKFVAGDSTRYTIAIYMMDINGEYVVTESELLGTTGAEVSITPNYSYTGFTVNTEKSNLIDTIAGDGSTVLSVYYDRNLYTATFDGVEYEVYYGASLPTVEPAAQEGKEFAAWTPAVPAKMPAEDLEFTSTWTDVVYKITYIINGTEEEYEYAAGATVTPIADPVVPGMTFIKWNKEIPTVMPAEDVIIVAEFEAAVFKVTFLDGDGRVFDEKAVQYGDTIVLPASNPTKEYHVFKGWLDVPETMPATNVTIYPDFERVPVRLVAAEGSTTVIDRSTMIITGLTEKFNDAKAARYLAVEGDGYYKLTSVEGYEGYYGTGAKVEVYDNADTSAPIEVFYIVIYGDVNGDSAANSLDSSLVNDEVLYVTSWSRGSDKDDLKIMAADLNKDGKIKQGDADSIENKALGVTRIDQASGTIIR